MGERFSESQMLKLVEIYRDYECLWNATSPFYKNRDARENAYEQILERLDVPGISVRDIPKKIKNLRTSYHQEWRKIKKSIREGATQDMVYTPKVSWFPIADGYLRAFSNIDENSNMALDNDDMETQNTESMYLPDLCESTNHNNAEQGFNVKEEYIEESFTSHFLVPSHKSVIKKRKLNGNDEDSHETNEKNAKNINKYTNSLIEYKEDEFDVFGRYIAVTLRSLPGELAIIAKTDVQKAVAEIQLRALRQNTQSLSLS